MLEDEYTSASDYLLDAKKDHERTGHTVVKVLADPRNESTNVYKEVLHELKMTYGVQPKDEPEGSNSFKLQYDGKFTIDVFKITSHDG